MKGAIGKIRRERRRRPEDPPYPSEDYVRPSASEPIVTDTYVASHINPLHVSSSSGTGSGDGADAYRRSLSPKPDPSSEQVVVLTGDLVVNPIEGRAVGPAGTMHSENNDNNDNNNNTDDQGGGGGGTAGVGGPLEVTMATTDYQAYHDGTDEVYSMGPTNGVGVALRSAKNRILCSPIVASLSQTFSQTAASFGAGGGGEGDGEPDGIVKDGGGGGGRSWWCLGRSQITTADDSAELGSSAKDPGAMAAKVGWFPWLVSVFCSAGFIFVAMFVGVTAGLAAGVIQQYHLFNRIDWDRQVSVAFAGSSYLFVNDVPRLMEAVSDGQVSQDSCLHAGGSLATLLMTGNGMYRQWQTSDALIQVNASYYDDDNNGEIYSTQVYDYGSCSVHQLLSGEDQYIEYGNDNKAYYNDGNNPCLLDEEYLYYAASRYEEAAPAWDYVVLADQSKRMASSQARYDTVDALVSVYAPLLEESGAIPVLVDTHAFWSSQTNMTGLSDIPTFTRMIYEGVEEYVEALREELPDEQSPVVVPIGLAYLTVWEENYDVWTTLFLNDQMHASLYGSYLFSVCLYATLFGHLPKKQVSVPDHIEYLFVYSRKVIGQSFSYPTADEANYLRNIAKRVVLDGHVPSSFQEAVAEAADESAADYDYDADD